MADDLVEAPFNWMVSKWSPRKAPEDKEVICRNGGWVTEGGVGWTATREFRLKGERGQGLLAPTPQEGSLGGPM